MNNNKVITAIVIGTGSRGRAYAEYARKNPYDLQIVGVAEPDLQKRENFVNKHPVDKGNIYTDWKDILQKEKFADVAFICTQDNMHLEPAICAMEKGYNLLLEKPVATDRESCDRIYQASIKNNVSVAVAHVLRYTDFFSKLRELIRGGEIGKIKGIQHNENIGHIHYSHSYVRGNWRRESLSSPILLAKSCHDMDILLYLTGASKAKISSFGMRSVFTSANKPPETPERCLEGCPERSQCPYFAPNIYMTGSYEWPVDTITSDFTQEAVEKAIMEGPYGRCVFSCDNDVLEHQTVNMVLDDKIPVVFSMSAFTESTSRTIKIVGEWGQINGNMEKNEIEIHDFRNGEIRTINQQQQSTSHGGGDTGIVKDLVSHLRDSNSELKSSIENSLLSHYMVFAAEEARKEDRVVSVSL